jgi:hypothetical protein
MASSELEPATFRIIVQSLNHLHYSMLSVQIPGSTEENTKGPGKVGVQVIFLGGHRQNTS